MFRFHFFEPIWYHVPNVKAPESSLRKGRWLGLASTAGDPMTYYIRTEKEPGEGRDVVLIRSVIRTRRKNIGQPNEYVNDDPAYADFFLTPPSTTTPSIPLDEVLSPDPTMDTSLVETTPADH